MEKTAFLRPFTRAATPALVAVLAAILAACGGGEPVVPPAIEARPAAVNDTIRPIHRFAKTGNGSYFYTGDEAEKELILSEMRAEMRYEGIAFMHSGGVPVYRFANLGNGGYFYTANPAERDVVQRTRPDMRFEGSTFSVAETGAAGAQQVWRLANLRNGAYLYTANPDEVKAAVGLGFWRDEGPAFQALPLAAAPRATAMGCFNAAHWAPGVEMSRIVDTYKKQGRGDFVAQGLGILSAKMQPEMAPYYGGDVVVEEILSGSGTSARTDLRQFRVEHGDVTWMGSQARYLLGGSLRVIETTTVFAGAPEFFFTAPPGTTVTRTSDATSGRSPGETRRGQVTRSVTFLGFEDLRIAAGTFRDACRFRIVHNESDPIEHWFAQGSGVELRTESATERHDLLSIVVNGQSVTP